MRIAIISPEFPPKTNWGGVATFNENLACLLTSSGHDVTVITSGDSLPMTVSVDGGSYAISYVLHSSMSSKGFFQRLCMRFFPRLSYILRWNSASYPVFQKLHREKAFDVVHVPTYQSPAILLKLRFPRLKVIAHVQGTQEMFHRFEGRTKDTVLVAQLEYLSMKYLWTTLVACSFHAKKQLLMAHPELSQKVRVIANFMKDTPYRLGTYNQNRIVYWGRLEYRKGVDILLQSFVDLARRNKKLSLYLIGQPNGFFPQEDGSSLDFWGVFAKIVTSHEIRQRIHFTPAIADRNELMNYLKKLRGIAVFPSRFEPFGYTTTEAMNMGYVVIAGKGGGASEIISDGVDGLLSKLNVVSIATNVHKIQRMSSEEISAITLNAKHKLRNFYSVHAVEKIYKSFYEEHFS